MERELARQIETMSTITEADGEQAALEWLRDILLLGLVFWVVVQNARADSLAGESAHVDNY